MREHQSDKASVTKPDGLRSTAEPAPDPSTRLAFDPVQELAQGAAKGSAAEGYAAALNRATGFQPSRAAHSLLRLQRSCGNSYVQRVLALAREEAGAEVTPDIESGIDNARGGGRPLDLHAQKEMGSAFGANFSDVRVHTDSQADSLNRSLNAIAFTTGRDIFFSRGAYDSSSRAGKELLAHELTHVVQQGGSTIQTKLSVSEPGDHSEQEATRVASEVVRQLESSSAPRNGSRSDSLRQNAPSQTCSCGRETNSGGECKECRSKSLSERAHSTDASTRVRTLENDEDIGETAAAQNCSAEAGVIQRQDDGSPDGGSPDGGAPAGPVTETATTCSPSSANFTSIPSGTLTPTLSGGKFGVPFDMKAEFTTPVPCTCVSGEYRQFVRGFFKVNGTALSHSLCSNAMSTTTFFEDCATISGTDFKYGYHSIPFATSKFTSPDQATGCKFVGFDYPGVNTGSLSTGDKVEIHLDFKGKLVDASSGDAELKSSAWTVDGSMTMP